jgi:PKD repeat protein
MLRLSSAQAKARGDRQAERGPALSEVEVPFNKIKCQFIVKQTFNCKNTDNHKKYHMNTKTNIQGTVALLFLIMFSLVSCTEDEIRVPAPSAQANFSFSFETSTDAATGSINYIVTFENHSLQATGYLWDFGNGNTSTEQNPVEIYTLGGVYEVTLTVTPTEELHYNNLVKAERMTLVPTIYREQFDDPVLEDNFPPEGWTLIDEDGDGNNWYWGSSQGESYILSDSWISGTNEVLTPDNWIITPQIDLRDVNGADLEFEVTPRATNPDFRTENYSVLVSVTGTNPEDFETIYTERLQPSMVNWVWVLRNVNLSQFAGEQIYIAFRHHDSTDLWSIVLRDIHVYETVD